MGKFLENAIENFEKKIDVLRKIKEVNEDIIELFSEADDINEEKYNDYMEKKSSLIESIELLNEEADDILSKFSEEMDEGAKNSPDLVDKMKSLIEAVNKVSGETDKDEKIIKGLMERYFNEERGKIKAAHKNSGAAINYYQTMSASKNVESMFFDDRN